MEYMWKVQRLGGTLPPFPSRSPGPALTLVPLLTATKACLSQVSALPPSLTYVLGVYSAPAVLVLGTSTEDRSVPVSACGSLWPLQQPGAING